MDTNDDVLEKIGELYAALFRHDGFGEIRIEMRILKRQQKEIIVHCGKQYRYVVDFQPDDSALETPSLDSLSHPPDNRDKPKGGV